MKIKTVLLTVSFILFALINQAYSQYFYSSGQAYNTGTSSEKLVRLPGAHYYHTGTGCGCMMCFGNHLINHGFSYNYLTQIGYNQWGIAHDNIHNGATIKSQQINQPEGIDLFAPTPQPIIDSILTHIQPKTSDIVYDLGSGDGRFLITASKKYGCKTIGIEIDGELVQKTKDRITAENLSHFAVVYQRDLLKTNISNADIIFIYLSEKLNTKLLPQLKFTKPNTLIVSYAHFLPGIETEEIIEYTLNDKSKHIVYIYITPLNNITSSNKQVYNNQPFL